jgi:hypothetical protein
VIKGKTDIEGKGNYNFCKLKYSYLTA